MNTTVDVGLEFQGSLPFTLEPVSAFPDAAELLLINHGNEQVLKTVMLLEEKAEPDDGDPVMIELKRQEQKINLLLDMLSTLLVQFKAVPPPSLIQLTDSFLSYEAASPPHAGPCLINLYIEPAIPRPLQIYGVCSYDKNLGKVTVKFEGMSRALTDNLDKYIFRFHRRMVATSKASPQAEPDETI